MKLLVEMLTFVRNEKGRPEAMANKHDDCFVKGTKILTDKGQINIEDIKVGDMVMTRKGFFPVEITRSRIKKVIKNIGLTGTLDHPIILVNNKQKKLHKVSHYDRLHIWNQQKEEIQNLSFIEAKDIIENQTQKEDNIRFTSGDMINGNLHHFHYIDRYGLIILEKFQKVFQFIIEIIILIIIQLIIWNFYLLQIMLYTICKKEELKKEVYVKINNVKKNLNIILLEVQNGVPIDAIVKTDVVYNLQIKECHEYFANNILVHNCIMSASIAYAVLQEQGKYIDDSQPGMGFSLSKAMFGEDK